MTPWKARGLGFGLLASACAALLDGTSMLTAAPAFADDTADYTALVMGHAFLPTPDETYIQEVIGTYVDPSPAYFSGQPVYNVDSTIGVYTPESDYGSGLTQGVSDLNTAIEQQLAAGNNDVVVVGYSESDSIATQEMINLAAEGNPDSPTADSPGLTFVLAENLNNPDGGYFTRFPGVADPSLPATPADTPYTTDIYSIEYSGASDFPQYDNDWVADLNAADGYVDLHPYLLTDWTAYFTPAELAGAVKEPTSVADVATNYYIIPTQDLPLLDGLRDGPGAPSPFADMIQPDLRVLVDLGYNWTGDADVDTPVGTMPAIDTAAVDAYLAAGADQGMIAYLVDLGILPQADLSNLSDLYPYVPDVAGLETGALTNDTLATADATTSLAALETDLADSTSPLATDLSTYLPGVATDLADFFANTANSFSL
jgi:diacyltrehalose acyltransferase